MKPEVVVRIDFAEWTGSNKLRHYVSRPTMSSWLDKTLKFTASALIRLAISLAP